MMGYGRRGCTSWLPGKDSNLKWVIQSHQCYHYTTRQLMEVILPHFALQSYAGGAARLEVFEVGAGVEPDGAKTNPGKEDRGKRTDAR